MAAAYENSFEMANKTGTWEEKRANMESLENLPPNQRRQALDSYYEDWLTRGYEEGLSYNGYVGHTNLAREMSLRFPAKSMRILDCASGSGLLGVELKKLGFTSLDALDSSLGSLDFSRSKNVYTEFICFPLGPERLPFEDDTYDGICLTAAFGKGHVYPDCLPEWVRITKPGGLIMFLVREETLIRSEGFCDGALDAILHKMVDEGCWEFLEKKRTVYMNGPDIKECLEYSYMYVLKVM